MGELIPMWNNPDERFGNNPDRGGGLMPTIEIKEKELTLTGGTNPDNYLARPPGGLGGPDLGLIHQPNLT